MSIFYDYVLPVIYDGILIYILINGVSDNKWIDIPIRLFVVCPIIWTIMHCSLICLFALVVITIYFIYRRLFGENVGGN